MTPQNPILKAHLEGVEQFDKLAKKKGIGGLARIFYKSFLTTYGTNLLKATLEAGPGEKSLVPELPDNFTKENATEIFENIKDVGFNSALSSFTSVIVDGIKGIEKEN